MKSEIDAVAMTRAIRDAHYEVLKDATPEERLQFYREKARRLQERTGIPAQQPARPLSG
jgi:hypothetical protein